MHATVNTNQKSQLMLILYVYIILQNYIRRYVRKHSYTKSCLEPMIQLFTTTSLYNNTSVVLFEPALHLHKNIFFTSFIKTYQRSITLFYIMSGWQPAYSVTPSSQEKTSETPSESWQNCNHAHPRMPGRPLIILRSHVPTLVED